MYTEDSIYWIIYIFVIKWSNKSQFTPEYASVFPGNCPVSRAFSSPLQTTIHKIAYWTRSNLAYIIWRDEHQNKSKSNAQDTIGQA